MTRIDFENIFKVRINNPDESFHHHEVTKLLIVTKLLKKYKRNLQWIRIYTEQYLQNGTKPDVYFENIKTKEVICFEIQKELSEKWLENKKIQYGSLDIPYFKVDFIVIPLKKAPTEINKLNKWLDAYLP